MNLDELKNIDWKNIDLKTIQDIIDFESWNWMKIGMIVSLLWVVSMTFLVFYYADNRAVGSTQALYESCAAVSHSDVRGCLKAVLSEDYPHNKNETMNDGFRYWPSFAFGPVVIGWIIGYAIKFLLIRREAQRERDGK
jgi:hypothetical protein